MTKELQDIDYNVTVLTNSPIANSLAPGYHDEKDAQYLYQAKRMVQRKRKIIKNYIIKFV